MNIDIGRNGSMKYQDKNKEELVSHIDNLEEKLKTLESEKKEYAQILEDSGVR